VFNAVKVESVPLNFVFLALTAGSDTQWLVMRFNPPPNWPASPPGWTPPPGWQPDPSWPPPPPGWQLWAPEQKPRRRGLIAGLVVGGVVVVAVIVYLVAVLALRVWGSGQRLPPTDEERIRSVVAGFSDAWNDSDFTKFKAYFCGKSLKGTNAPTADKFSKQRGDDGRITIHVISVKVTGETATAELVEKYDKKSLSTEENLPFVLENGEWKACP
jgi:hypothetical protein